jgi:predicted RNase H-like HicB family nuclease
MTDTYRVVVTRDGSNWLADVPDVEGVHTFARTLAGLEREVREAIAVVLDLPEGGEAALELTWELHTGDDDLDTQTTALRLERRRLAQAERDLADRTAAMARRLRQEHWSVRDVAALLGVSPQRVSQVSPEDRPTRGGKRPAAA